MFRSYLRLLLFTLGLLLGVQVPGFIDDYAKRVDAHRLETSRASSRPPGSSSTVAWRNWSGITAATAIRCSSATARTSTA